MLRYRARRVDPIYVLQKRMKSQLYGRSHMYDRDIEAVLGYSIAELKDHIESQFTRGMTWAAFVRGEIHIDHVVPLVAVRHMDDEAKRLAWSLQNLRPLWRRENLTKSGKLPEALPSWFTQRQTQHTPIG